MKKIILKVLSAAILSAAVFAQNDMTPLVVVKYNKSETITLKQLKTRAFFVQKQYGIDSLPLDQKQVLLENMISEKLLLQAATKENVTISDSQVDNSFLASFSQQLGRQITEAELSNYIKQSSGKTLDEYIKDMSGMTLAEYKAYLKTQLVIQNYVSMKKQSEIQAVAATDKEIRDAYELNKSNFKWDDMMRLFLVMVPKGDDDVAAKALCEDIRNKYTKDPKKSVEIVNSPDNGTKYQAGEITVAKTVQQAQLLRWPEEKMTELFSHAEKYVSDVTKTATDFQFFVVLKKYDAKLLSLSDVVQPETTITVYDYIKGNLTQQKQYTYFKNAAQDMGKELNVPEYVDRKKKDEALNKLLNW